MIDGFKTFEWREERPYLLALAIRPPNHRLDPNAILVGSQESCSSRD